MSGKAPFLTFTTHTTTWQQQLEARCGTAGRGRLTHTPTYYIPESFLRGMRGGLYCVSLFILKVRGGRPGAEKRSRKRWSCMMPYEENRGDVLTPFSQDFRSPKEKEIQHKEGVNDFLTGVFIQIINCLFHRHRSDLANVKHITRKALFVNVDLFRNISTKIMLPVQVACLTRGQRSWRDHVKGIQRQNIYNHVLYVKGLGSCWYKQCA